MAKAPERNSSPGPSWVHTSIIFDHPEQSSLIDPVWVPCPLHRQDDWHWGLLWTPAPHFHILPKHPRFLGRSVWAYVQYTSSKDIKRHLSGPATTQNISKYHRKFPFHPFSMVQQKTIPQPQWKPCRAGIDTVHAVNCWAICSSSWCPVRPRWHCWYCCVIYQFHPVSVESKHNESTLAMDVVKPMQSTCRLPAASSKSSEVSSSVH